MMTSDASGDFRQFLRAELLRRIKRNPRYSVRAFARSLETDKSTLSKLMSGKRPLGKRSILRLGTKLDLAPETLESFVQKEDQRRERSLQARQEEAYRQVALDSFRVISDWYHYGILELMRVDHFEHDYEWVGNALGLSENQVRAAVNRMIRLGMMEVTEEGKWIDRTDVRTTTTGMKFTDEALRKFQHQMLSMARTALEETPFDERDQSAVTFAADSSQLAEAKERITRFRRDLSRFLSRGTKRDRVYHLCVSLYPVSAKPGTTAKKREQE